MLKGVSESAPTKEYARAAFYLIKEVGLSHEEIFGGKQVVVENGKPREVHISAMNVRTFHAYLDLFEEHVEEKKKEQEKAKMKRNMKSKMGGGRM